MGERISRKPVEISDQFIASRRHIYDYTLDTFGYFQTKRYRQLIGEALATLSDYYVVYPECRHLATKTRMYRNIILDAHLIIYRITDKRIEVLDIVHAASSLRRIRAVRNIHL